MAGSDPTAEPHGEGRSDRLPAVLHGLLSPAAADLYVLLLSGRAPDGPSEALDELRRVGLVTPAPGADRPPVAADPRAAFIRLLAESQRQIAARHEELARVLGALDALRLEYDLGEVPGEPAPVIEILRDRVEIARVVHRLRAAARDRYAALVAPGPGGAPGVAGDPPLGWPDESDTDHGTAQVRVLYAAAVGRTLPGTAGADVQVRLIPEAPLDMRVTDDHTAIVALAAAPDDYRDGLAATGTAALLVRSEPIVRLLGRCLELLWERATPTGAGQVVTQLTPYDRRILTLLAAGHRDERIARLTGTSIRTVRRRVTAILTELGVDSRFAAGIEAYRRGWLRSD